MWRLCLILGLSLSVNACSNASFKGMSGGKSRNDSAPPETNTEDVTKGNPPVPDQGPQPIPPAPPGAENPNTQNPGPCESMNLSLASLYHLHDEQCHQTDTGDSGEDDDDMDDDDSDNPGQNNPGQN
ncbi:MAG TPA: hypothetical protein VFO10_12330 [Oligoflexus sp.]|uniref:hypothetical protein n=1 Tax=Oligoflexus sp. TaxID=1971216 RepID=UPI002D7F2274|nr:hypothetical protein [Oligoflexus sp.]HET9238036.1 hypothetical protein [Oligoflexus sp.]